MMNDMMRLSSDDIIKLFGRPGEKDAMLARCEMALEREREKREEAEREVERLRGQKDELEKEVTQMTGMLRESQMRLLYLQNLIILSSDKVRQFAESMKDIENWAMMRTMLTFCLHQEWRQEGEHEIEEAMSLPQAAPQVRIEHIEGDCVVEKNVSNNVSIDREEKP